MYINDYNNSQLKINIKIIIIRLFMRRIHRGHVPVF